MLVEFDEDRLNRLRSAENSQIAAPSSVKYSAAMPPDCCELVFSSTMMVVPSLLDPASSTGPDIWREAMSLVGDIAALGGFERLAALRLGSLASGRAVGANLFKTSNPRVRVASESHAAVFDAFRFRFGERPDRETLIAAAIEGGAENVDGLIRSFAAGMHERAVEFDFVFSGCAPGGAALSLTMESMLVEGGNDGSRTVWIKMPTHLVIKDGDGAARQAGMRLTCQSARNLDPRSASNIDPLGGCGRRA